MYYRLLDFFSPASPTTAPILTLIVSRRVDLVNSTANAAKFFRSIWDKKLLDEQEQVCVIFVDSALRPIEWRCIHTGGVCKTIIDVKLIMSLAFKNHASGMFIAHNHPRRKSKPSEVDKLTTEAVQTACKIFDIVFHDHIILSKNHYYSFREDGLIS